MKLEELRRSGWKKLFDEGANGGLCMISHPEIRALTVIIGLHFGNGEIDSQVKD